MLEHWIHTLYLYQMQLESMGAFGHGMSLFIQGCAFVAAPEVLFTASLLKDPSQFWFLFSITLLASWLGGTMDYVLGRVGGQPILQKAIKPHFREKALQYFKKYGSWTLVIASLLPIPFKPVVLTTGVFRLPFLIFCCGFLTGRSIRYLGLGGLVYYFHHEFMGIFQKFGLVIGVSLLVILGIKFCLNRIDAKRSMPSVK